MRRLLALSVGLVLLADCADKPEPEAAVGPVVHIDTGDVRGTVHPDRRVFEGIPYAAPPPPPRTRSR